MAIEPLFGLSISMLLLLAGAGLMVAEALAPGAHFFVIGVALFVAGLVGVFLPPGIGGVLTPLILSAVILVVAGATLWLYRQYEITDMPSAGRTSDSDSLRGKTGRVVERVTETEGVVKLDGGGFNPNFQARSVSGTIAQGEQVIVLDPGGGNVVTVEAIGDLEDDIDRELAKGRSEEAATDGAIDAELQEAAAEDAEEADEAAGTGAGT
jgi:membrane protein implicated in regulation of membrane protease activity